MLELSMLGNLGSDPEMRFTSTGQAVTNISLPSTRKWVGTDGQKKEETTWVRWSFWGKRAEVINNYFAKGDLILVKGRLKPTIVIFDRQDGSKGAAYEAIAESFEFCGKTSGHNGASNGGSESMVAEGGAGEAEDDIPF